MTKTKRVISVPLFLCMCGALFAGLGLGLPLQADAAVSISIVNLQVTPQTLTMGTTLTISADVEGFPDNEPAGVYAIIQLYTSEGGSWVLKDTAISNVKGMGAATHILLNYDLKQSYNDLSIYVTVPASGNYSSAFSNIVIPGPSDAPATPTEASDAGTDEYYQRHYDFWIGARAKLDALPNSGSVTVDTAGHDLDHIQHFVFDALVGTNRSLTVKHQGQTCDKRCA